MLCSLGLLLLVVFVSSTLTASCPKVSLLSLPSYSQINATSPGAEDNKYGFEDGIVVRRNDGTFSMISAEMYADIKWVAMRLGIWKSQDGYKWTKQRSIRISSANFDGSDIHSSSWGPFLLFDPSNNTWAISYVGYRGAPSNSSGWLTNFEGTIFGQYANVEGDPGLDSDFGDSKSWRQEDHLIVKPDDFSVTGPWPYQCQGMQGTDSFFPFQLPDKTWVSFLGTSFQELPDHRPGTGLWQVSLATSKYMFGPWTRYNPTNLSHPADAPCVDINGGYTENPIVSHRPDNPNSYQVVFDYLGKEDQGFGYMCSDDGFNWFDLQLVAIPGGCRTPYGLIPFTSEEEFQYKELLLLDGSKEKVEQLYWLFFTQNVGNYEVFRNAIVKLSF